jgi:cell division septum initiation protein DivIVA
MAHVDFLARRPRRVLLGGCDPGDVQAVLEAAESRQHELEQEVARLQAEVQRLQAEVGRAYTSEAGVARTLLVAQETAARIKAEAEEEAARAREAAERHARFLVESAREDARRIAAAAEAKAADVLRAAEARLAELRPLLAKVEADVRAVAGAGRDLAAGLLERMDAALRLAESFPDVEAVGAEEAGSPSTEELDDASDVGEADDADASLLAELLNPEVSTEDDGLAPEPEGGSTEGPADAGQDPEEPETAVERGKAAEEAPPADEDPQGESAQDDPDGLEVGGNPARRVRLPFAR